MSTGLVFVTAQADPKTINRILLYLRDWEYGSGDRFHVVRTKNAYDIEEPTLESTAAGSLTTANLHNFWAGASLQDVEDFVTDAFESPGTYLVIDEQSLRDECCVIAHKVYRDGETNYPHPARYDKTRLSWDQAYIMWCNLDIGNMSFDEFCRPDPSEDGWWELNPFDGMRASEECIAKRVEAMKALYDKGSV